MFRPAAALACAALTLTAPLASAEPILKPHKYYGPIPQSAWFLRGGVLGGATNEEMIAYQDSKIQAPFSSVTEDFGDASPTLEVGFVYKPHPHFGGRLNASYSALKSTSTGNAALQTPDSLLLVDFTREFKVDLLVLEASALYYFADASVKEFQTYLGGGFSFGFPHQTYQETRADAGTGEAYDPIEKSEWDFSAGVHAVLGLLYYVSNRFGVSAEGRLQLMESTFDQLEVPDESGGQETASFVVDYTGFYLTLGVLWAF
jgi:hypothetical protein